MKKKNEPQLSVEMEKRFDACLEGICYISSGANKYGSWKKYSQVDDGLEYDITSEIENLKTLLATALEEQRAKYTKWANEKIAKCEKLKDSEYASQSSDYFRGKIAILNDLQDILNGKSE